MTQMPRVALSEVVAIVPAFRAAADLRTCLPALEAAGIAADRIVVVDDASGDDTPDVAAGLGVRVVRADRNGGPAAARNLGIAATTAPVILFVDADVVIHADAPRLLLERLNAPDAPAGVFGSYDDAPAAPGTVSRVRNLMHHHVHQTGTREPTTFWTGLGIIRRVALAAVGGFEEGDAYKFVEDVKLGVDLWRKGLSVALEPRAQCTHLKRWTLRGAFRTDLFHRALPWTGILMEEGRTPPAQLAGDGAARLSVAATAVAGLGLLAAVLGAPGTGLAVAVAALGAIAALNRDVLGLVRRRLGAGALPTAFVVLVSHFLAAGLGAALALVRAGRRRAVGASGS